MGAVTWANGGISSTGTVSPSNSLIGSVSNDQIGSKVVALTNGNYVTGSPNWNGTRGAVTWGNGATGTSGTVSPSNSLVGSNVNDQVGYPFALSDGNYVIESTTWNGSTGAFTMGSGSFALVGTVQPWNSVIGTYPEGTFAYDPARKRLVVGRPIANVVSLFTMDQIFADGFQ
jgi:hypothetical protein